MRLGNTEMCKYVQRHQICVTSSIDGSRADLRLGSQLNRLKKIEERWDLFDQCIEQLL